MLVKTVTNSVLLWSGAKFECFDAANFYLQTLMPRPEYVRIKVADPLDKFRKEFGLNEFKHKGWCYFEVVRGAYGLPQSGKLANDMLRKRLNKRATLKLPQRQGFGTTHGARSSSC